MLESSYGSCYWMTFELVWILPFYFFTTGSITLLAAPC
mgnify:FL=1